MTVTIRMPDDLHALLLELAQRDDRSLNAEIVRLLRHVAPQAKANPI